MFSPSLYVYSPPPPPHISHIKVNKTVAYYFKLTEKPYIQIVSTYDGPYLPVLLLACAINTTCEMKLKKKNKKWERECLDNGRLGPGHARPGQREWQIPINMFNVYCMAFLHFESLAKELDGAICFSYFGMVLMTFNVPKTANKNTFNDILVHIILVFIAMRSLNTDQHLHFIIRDQQSVV